MYINFETDFGMAYIYLRPPKHNSEAGNIEKETQDNIFELPAFETISSRIEKELEKIEIKENVYCEAVENEFGAEYGIDFNESGYLTGIETRWTVNHFCRMLSSREAFKTYRIKYDSEDFILTTFDIEENVFNPANTIYPMTENHDVFLVIYIDPRDKISYIKALLSKKHDYYLPHYLAFNKFVIRDEGTVKNPCREQTNNAVAIKDLLCEDLNKLFE